MFEEFDRIIGGGNMIEVGEYIRDKEGNITKIINTLSLFKDVELYLGEDSYRYSDNAIKNHSKNIIDLIEVGDYVNGKRVFATDNRINDNGEKVILTENYDEWTDDGVIANKDIKIILTKEQYEANCYKVKEEIC